MTFESDATHLNTDESRSPYAHVLHTNYVPSDAEVLEIKSYLSKPESELHRLEIEVARARAILDKLFSEHDKLEQFVDAHRILITPMRRLPPEIFQEIFVQCLSTSRNSVMHSREAPMLLTEVCSDWRRIALSTPALWSSLHFVFPHPASASDGSKHARFDAVRAWLARSGTLSKLSISVYSEFLDDSQPTLTKSLGSFIHRCKRLKITAPLEHIARLGVPSLPELEDVTIHGRDWISSSDTLARLDTFSFLKDAPSLRKVKLTKIVDIWPILRLPFGKLEALHLEASTDDLFTSTSALEILNQCQNLRVCSLRYDQSLLAHRPDHTRTVTLPLVHSFSIFADGHGLQQILGYLILPKLREFNLSQNQMPLVDDRFDLPALLSSLLDRSCCVLKKCKLSLSPGDLAACLSIMPSVVDLNLTDHLEVIGDAFIRRFVRTETDPYLGPNLERIILTRCFDVSGDLLVDFIRSRQTSIPRLIYACIVFDVNPHFSTAVSQIIDGFRHEGVDIVIRFPDNFPPWIPQSNPWDGLRDDASSTLVF